MTNGDESRSSDLASSDENGIFAQCPLSEPFDTATEAAATS
jgi:hypothetical protein